MEDLPLYNWFERGMELLWKFGFVVLVSQNDGKGIFTRGTRIRFSLAKSGSAGAAEPTGSPPVSKFPPPIFKIPLGGKFIMFVV